MPEWGAITPLRRLYAAQLLTQTAVWFRNFAVSLLVLQTTGDAAALGWVTVAQFAPMLLLGPLPGRWADRGKPRQVLRTANVVAAVTALSLALTPSGVGSLWAVYAALVVGGIGQALERPAAFGLTADLVPLEQLGPALARHTVAASAGRFIGPGLAGLAYAAAGPRLCFAIACTLAVIVIGLVASLPSGRAVIESPAPSETRPAPGASRGRSRRLPWVLVVSALVTLTALNFNVTVTAMMTLELGAGVAALGLFHTLNAVGAIAGGWLASTRRRMGPASLAPAAAALGVGLLVGAATGTPLEFLIVAPALGALLGWYQSVLQRAAQVAAGPGRTARAASWVNLTTFGLTPASALWAGYLADAASPRATMLVGGVGGVLAGVVAALTLRRRTS